MVSQKPHAVRAVVICLIVGVFASPAAVAGERSFQIEPFDAVEASNGIRVEMVIGDDWSVSAEGPADELAELYVDVGRDRLVVRPRMKRFGDQMDMSGTLVRIVAPSVVDVETENGAWMSLSGLDIADVELEATNGGGLEVTGVCTSAEIVARRGGVVDAHGLECASVRARASTGGEVRAYAGEEVDAGVSLGGSISVAGSPARVRRNNTLTGDIRVW